MRCRVRGVAHPTPPHPKPGSAPGSAREQERARLSAGPSAAPRLPAPATSLLARSPSRSPAPALAASGAPAQAASGPRCCHVPSSRRLAPRAPTSPPPGPYLAVLTLGLRGAVRARSSSSAPAEPRRKPALGPPRRRLSSVSRAAGPGPAPIGPRRRPSRPARLRAGGLLPAEARARAASIVAVS